MFDTRRFRRGVYLRILRWRILARNLGNVYIVLAATSMAIIGIATLMWRHFGTDASLPVLADMTPILLAIVGIIMSYIPPKKETRLITSFVLIVVGILGSAVLTIARLKSEKSHSIEIIGLNNKIDAVSGQNTKLGNFLIEERGTGRITEADRRRGIETTLRSEYIIAHNPIDPQILAGNAMPPQDWMNQRLSERGEKWTVSENSQGQAAPVIPRSYLVFDGSPIFVGSTTPTTEGGDFKPGDPLAFNVHYKATGPNSVDFIGMGDMLSVEPNTETETQQKALASYTEEFKKESKTAAPDASTLAPGDARFITATIFTGTKQLKAATQDDLDKLRAGKEVVFLISEIIYKDHGVIHHQRRCVWLQPPASPPGIWHFCEVFSKSD